MADTTNDSWQPANPETLGRAFSRLGWLGFWIQALLLAIPVALLVYVLFLRSPDSAQQIGIDLTNYLSYGSLLVMLFTTLWFLRYPGIGKRIRDPYDRPAQTSVEKVLWVGLWAGCIGVFFSLLMLIGSAARMLFVMLANPQTGLMVAPAPGGDPVQSLSAFDAISLTALLVVLAAELVVLGFTLWLLFRTSRRPAKGQD